MLVAHVAMIGCEQDDGVFDQPGFADGGQDLAHIVIDALHHTEVLGHVIRIETSLENLMWLAPPGQILSRLVHGRGSLQLTGVHGVVWRANQIWPVRIGNREHVAEGLVLMVVDEVDRLVGEEVSRVILRSSAVAADLFVVDHPRAFRRVFELLPMAMMHHVAVIGKAKLPLALP